MARRASSAAAPAGRRETTSRGVVPDQPDLPPAPAPGRLRALPPDWLPAALLAGDALIVAGGWMLSFAYHRELDFLYRREALGLAAYLAALPVVVVFYSLALALNQQYRSWRGRTLLDRLLSLYSGIGLATLAVLAAIALTSTGYYFARLTVAYTALLSAILLTAERYLLRQYETRLRRRGIGAVRTLMAGTGTASELLIRRMSMFPQYGYLVCGVLEDELRPGGRFGGAPVLGCLDDLPRMVSETAARQVFIALGGGDPMRLRRLVGLCEENGVEFQVVPDLYEFMNSRVEASAIDGLPLIGLRPSHLNATNAALKRTLDAATSALALAILSPVLLSVAALIKLLMPGPVLFRQERIGLGGRPFTILKFRSMIVDAEAETGPVVARPKDPRVTRLGRFLRGSSLDELPQLWNVLRGDMSVVGPRPQPAYFDAQYRREVPRYAERQRVRPGLTGWAEVNDLRGAAPIGDRTFYDVYYVENWSWKLDLKIVLLTALRLFFQRHAY